MSVARFMMVPGAHLRGRDGLARGVLVEIDFIARRSGAIES